MPESKKALNLIIEERIRQTLVEGYTPAHDDEHIEGQLALLAAAYALSSQGFADELQELVLILDAWGWGEEEFAKDGFKPKDPICDLVRAGALILAELERRLRVEEKEKMDQAPSGITLPRWKSHKIVKGDKIVGIETRSILEEEAVEGDTYSVWVLACGVRVFVSHTLFARVPEGVDPVGGYFALYEDGFRSWSPAKAWEDGNTRLP